MLECLSLSAKLWVAALTPNVQSAKNQASQDLEKAAATAAAAASLSFQRQQQIPNSLPGLRWGERLFDGRALTCRRAGRPREIARLPGVSLSP